MFKHTQNFCQFKYKGQLQWKVTLAFEENFMRRDGGVSVQSTGTLEISIAIPFIIYILCKEKACRKTDI